jgi:hypothetical protein
MYRIREVVELDKDGDLSVRAAPAILNAGAATLAELGAIASAN